MVKPYSNKKEYVKPESHSLDVDCDVVMTSPGSESSKSMSLSVEEDDDYRNAGSYRNSLWND